MFVKLVGNGDEEGDGDDNDEWLENVFGEIEPDKGDGFVAEDGCCNGSWCPFGDCKCFPLEYPEAISPFSGLILGTFWRNICNKRVCCIKANCSAPFRTLDVIKTSISGWKRIRIHTLVELISHLFNLNDMESKFGNFNSFLPG